MKSDHGHNPSSPAESHWSWITLALLGIVAVGLFLAWKTGVFNPLVVWAYRMQHGFVRDFTRLIRETRQAAQAGELYGTASGLATLASLMGIGFFYGVFHAVGPGHGKAVIATYALTRDIPARRTALLALAAALTQALGAIFLVTALSIAMEGSLGRIAKDADRLLEMVSYGAVGLVGCYLLVAGGRSLWNGRRQPKPSLDNRRDHNHDHGSCGHDHGPTPDQVRNADTWRKAAMVAVAVGLRPCSGAILVLVLTFALGLWFAGVMTVLVMAVGTGVTVAALSLSALGFRVPLVSALGALGLRAGPVLGFLGCLGGGLIASIAAMLLWGALNRPVHPFP